jgi:DNA-binding NarL/FixJ family response regulator
VEIRLLLAEEHRIVRQHLETLLRDHEGWQVVAEASDGREAVRLAETHRPDIAVVSLALPLLNGIEVTRRILEGSPVTKVIVLSPHSVDVYMEQTHLAGAVGFVLTDTADVDLPAAVEEVSRGGSFTSPRATKSTPTGGLSQPGFIDR